jgi:hypothetical protein
MRTTGPARRELLLAASIAFAGLTMPAGADPAPVASIRQLNEHGPKGAERLVIRTPGGLITIDVPLKGELSGDIENATAAANKIVASAKVLTADPARHLSSASGQRRQQ